MDRQTILNLNAVQRVMRWTPKSIKRPVRRAIARINPGAFALPIRFTPEKTPLVSIIIPVYGHLEETLQCLAALMNTAGTVSFEVIVVDDKSPDPTLETLERISGLRIVAKETNEGFVRACNSGLEKARGEYVVFLNNDTEVKPNWLAPLVLSMEDPTVGLVGSKLIYPDGKLQEAGALIFSDASGWNYGRGQNPENHSFNYVRDVDYCSGASIMIRRTILEQLGGFDERYIPAYYEDTDLAFSVRQLGFRTIYQPASVVVHFEGVSNGTDVSTGVKHYQEINKLKFAEKWASELREQPLSPLDNPDFEIERYVHSDRVILVLDDHIPTPDLDSGSVRMTQILLEMKAMGYEPILIPQSPDRFDPWSEWFGQHGIQAMYRTPGPNGWECIGPELMALLLLESVRCVFSSRTGVSAAFLFPVTHAVPHAPVVFDTVDLHGLRESREAALTEDPDLIRLAHRTEQLELGVMRASDITLVVSTVEKEILNEKYPDLDVRVLANVHVPVSHKAGLEGRSGIAFIGSFQHKPNVDGVRWYIEEIDPIVRRMSPDLPVRIYGKNPPKGLVALAPPNVSFEGYVGDLADVYDSARVTFAPLRYGAGVKGKVGEALSWGVPMVTTSIGAEGMGLEDGKTAWIADNAEEFARGIVKLLSDDSEWLKMSDAGEEHIESIMGPKALRNALEDILSVIDM